MIKQNPLFVCTVAVVAVLIIIGCKVTKTIKETEKKMPVAAPIIDVMPRRTPTNEFIGALMATAAVPVVEKRPNLLVWDWTYGGTNVTSYPVHVKTNIVEFDVEYKTSVTGSWSLLGRSLSNSMVVPTNVVFRIYRVGVHLK